MLVNATNVQSTYNHIIVDTSTTPLDLIIMLYDGAIVYLNKTVSYMNQGRGLQKDRYLSKSMAVIENLLASLNLDAGGQTALSLQDIYLYMLRELTIANTTNDSVKVRNVEGLLKKLRVAWRQLS
ncbi:MAG TPA: flagellar export chaperone FliS [Thermodesulfovibrionales bacterium]|nr:flagellar export chaperone FliS [Thermodesulfovibrionales bacterium]